GSSWDKFRGQISQMVFPYKDNRIFDVYLKLNGKNEDLDELNDKVRQNSVSNYTFRITENKLHLQGELKLRKLAGGLGDALKFYEENIVPDNGANFFDFLTNPKINKKFHLTNVSFSGKKGVLFTFSIEKHLADISKVSWIIEDKKNEDQLS